MRAQSLLLRENNFTDHDVRRIAANCADKSLVKAAKLKLNHSSAATTKVYLRRNIDEDLKQVIEGTYVPKRRKREEKAAAKGAV